MYVLLWVICVGAVVAVVMSVKRKPNGRSLLVGIQSDVQIANLDALYTGMTHM